MALALLYIKFPLIFLLCFRAEAFVGIIDYTNAEPAGMPKTGLSSDCNVKWMEAGELWNSTDKKLDIFCYHNTSKSIIYMFKQVYLKFIRMPNDYKLYGGEDQYSVCEKYRAESVFNPKSWFLAAWREESVTFPAFNQYCVGVYVAAKRKNEFTVQLVVRAVNYWKIALFLTGLLLFLNAPSLSRNSFFHYTSGISVGIFASVLVLVFILSRFIPKKGISYAMMVFSSSMVVYFLQQFWGSLPQILAEHPDIISAYACIVAFISFIICYRLGPVRNERTLNIIQWSLQILGLLFMFMSTEYKEAATSMIIVTVTLHFSHPYFMPRLRCLWYKYFPYNIRLLTESEYIEQGTKETKKALEELREYCNSPECNTWSTVRKLHDPMRFADFVEGASHLTNEEILDYEAEPLYEPEVTDDESDGRPEEEGVHDNNAGDGP